MKIASLLFLSLIPGNDILQQFSLEQDKLKVLLKDQNIKWEDPRQFHLTIRFLGDIDEDKVEPLSDTLGRLKFDFDTIEFNTDKIDFFPNRRFPNIIFAGLKEKGNNIETLVGFIDKIIFNFGIKPDKKFIPHITFGRFNRNKRRKIGSDLVFELTPLKIQFNSFSLMQSKLLPTGSEYEEISTFKFNT